MSEPEDRDVDAALDRLRAADPARDAPPLDLTASGVRERGRGRPVEQLDVGNPVTTRQRFRWQGVVILAAALALVVATGVTVVALRGHPVVAEPAGPGTPTAAQPSRPRVELDCTEQGREVKTAPKGAVSLRLCDASGKGPARVAPPDELTTDVAGLIALFESLPASHPQHQACTAELSATYTLVFGVPGEAPTHVVGLLYGCRVIGDRLGADKVLAGFVERLRAQRDASSQAKEVRLAPDCTTPRVAYVPPELDALTQGWLCWRAVDTDTFRTIPLSADEIADIRADLLARAGTDEVEVPRCPLGPQVALVLADGFGAPVGVDAICQKVWAFPLSGEQWWWVPSQPVAAMLTAHLPR